LQNRQLSILIAISYSLDDVPDLNIIFSRNYYHLTKPWIKSVSLPQFFQKELCAQPNWHTEDCLRQC